MGKIYFKEIEEKGLQLGLLATDNELCYVGALADIKAFMSTYLPIYHPVAAASEMKIYTDHLREYLNGERKEFQFNIRSYGSPLQREVNKAILEVPYGTTVSYSDIAKAIGKPKAVRAVGTAVGSSNLSIVVPCHRVLPKDGSLGGYRWGKEMKRFLLDLEARK